MLPFFIHFLFDSKAADFMSGKKRFTSISSALQSLDFPVPSKKTLLKIQFKGVQKNADLFKIYIARLVLIVEKRYAYH